MNIAPTLLLTSALCIPLTFVTATPQSKEQGQLDELTREELAANKSITKLARVAQTDGDHHDHQSSPDTREKVQPNGQ